MERRQSILRAGADELRQQWRTRDRDQAWMGWLGLGLMASGLLHVVVQLALGGPLDGPVSWRKPIVFGLSGGVTTLSLAWLIGQLPATPLRARSTRVYVVAMALEVGLITMQAWRGVPSHFNFATAFDGLVFGAMGALIAVASAVMALWTWQRWRARSGDAAQDRAARHGTLYLLGSLAVGFVMVTVSNELDPSTGAALVLEPGAYRELALLKLPHAVGLHGLQVLPVLAFLAARGALRERARLRLINLASTGYGLLFAASLAWPILSRVGAPQLLTGARPLLALAVALGLGLLALTYALSLFTTRALPWTRASAAASATRSR